MKRITVMLGVVLAVCACNRYQEATETETISLESACSRLQIEVPAGNITITGDSGADSAGNIELTAEKFVWARTENEAREQLAEITIETSLDNDTCRVVVTVPEWSTSSTGGTGGANLTFDNAGGRKVDISLGAGDISCDDITGGAIEIGAGSIDIGTCSGDVQIGCGAGNVSIDSTLGDFQVETGAGNIALAAEGTGARSGSAQTAVGDIDLELSAGLSCTVDLETAVGSIEVTGAGDVDTDTEGIDISASFTLNDGQGAVSAATAAGAIQVDVR